MPELSDFASTSFSLTLFGRSGTQLGKLCRSESMSGRGKYRAQGLLSQKTLSSNK